ncbi:MAG: geranylgeranyl reductase family protein [Vicinamibacterales bacterium]
MPDYDADVLIVGAGPAGAWAARQLALGGASVRLIDASHPREKPCGGGLTERAVVMLGDLVAQIPHVAIERVRFESPPVGGDPYPPPPRTPPSVTVAVPRSGAGSPFSPLVVVSRRAFDAALVDDAREAGADLIPERAVDVHVDEDAISVSTRQRRWRGRYLIGADGANSLVRRRLHGPLPVSHWSLATGVFAAGPTSREIAVRFVRQPPGYIWSFPRADHLAIGICAPADRTDAAELRGHLDRWVSRQNLPRDQPATPYSWPIPSLPAPAWADGVPTGPRWLLAGDAAGLVDPLTREGIYYALRSGALAAESLLGAGADPGRRYAGAVQSELVSELAMSARARGTFFSQLVTRLWIDVLRESPRVRSMALDVVVGAIGYYHLRRRAVAALEPRAALRVALAQAARYLRLAP